MSAHLISFASRLLLLTLIGAAATGARAADEAPTVIMLLDGSGSMWGRLTGDKQARFDIARTALSHTLSRIKPEARLGLASFGHRRGSNCRDAEVIVSPAPNNVQQILTPLQKMNATGKGPLVLGMLEAAEAIGKAAPASIVLLHDDVDNCGQDACKAASAIAKANPRLAIYPIGIALNKAKLEAMSCVAKLTGGKQFDAQDAAGITSALNQIVKLAHLSPGSKSAPLKNSAPEGTAQTPPVSGPPGLYLSASLSAKSPPLQSPVHWQVKKTGDGSDLIREATGPRLIEKLPPGSYDVEARLGLAVARKTVEVKADVPTPVRINLKAGVLKMLARASKEAPPLRSPVFTVTASGSDKTKGGRPLWIGRGPQAEIVLSEGDYQIRVEDGLARYEQTVKITPATGTTFDAALGTGRLELSAARGVDIGQGETVRNGVTFLVYVDDPDSPQGRREVARSAAPSPTFTLPAGTYYVTARTAGAEAREQIAIGAGDVVKQTLPLSLAQVKLSATLDGVPPPSDTPLTFTVTRLGGEPREVVRTVASKPEFELSAGRYRVEASLGAMNVKAAKEIALAAGQSQDVVLKLEAGQVTLKLADEAAAATSDVFWEIKDGNRHTVLRTSQPEPTTLLAPGQYIVKSDTRDRQLRSAFELKAGERRTLEVGRP